MNPEFIGQIVGHLFLLVFAEFYGYDLLISSLASRLFSRRILLIFFIRTAITIAIFWIFANAVLFVFDTNSNERLPSHKCFREDFRFKALLHDGKANLVPPILALAVDSACCLTNMLEAVYLGLTGHFVTNPYKNVWLEVQHEDRVRFEAILTKVVYLLQGHVLRMSPVVFDAKHVLIVTLIRRRISFFVRIIRDLRINQVLLIIIIDKASSIIDNIELGFIWHPDLLSNLVFKIDKF